MNETMVTVVGNVASTPVYREVSSGGVTRFRIAVTARRFDRAQQQWKDGATSFFTVWSWRTLAANVASCVTVGEPVMVQGRLRVRDGVREGDSDGRRWLSVDIDAVAVGHDLSRGTAAFRRVSRADPSLTVRPMESVPRPDWVPEEEPAFAREPAPGPAPGLSPEQPPEQPPEGQAEPEQTGPEPDTRPDEAGAATSASYRRISG
ncbi:single-stranded DNA-binding protein [Streptomyces apocyni]|uniref:single-stranded DNA-binding protein n=1 Tax=Streptomyces apocyni TaxID=2654677 RepID=UPI0012E9D984|nr:single-stranded DNA-binding protein [Streptomyces apocyni]